MEPTLPDPMPTDACGWILDDGRRRCGKQPEVRLTEEYATGERMLLCAEHRKLVPETFEWDGETLPAVEAV
jgi:hypothetical protein